jgi:hypothetical protein
MLMSGNFNFAEIFHRKREGGRDEHDKAAALDCWPNSHFVIPLEFVSRTCHGMKPGSRRFASTRSFITRGSAREFAVACKKKRQG